MFAAIDLNGRGVALVDDIDADRIGSHRWYLHSKGYACTAQGRLLMHRLIMDAPARVPVDHIDGNRLDNRRNNLRLANFSTNAFNRHQGPSSLTGVRGVQRRGNRYLVYITKAYKNLYMGSFGSLREAVWARHAAEVNHFGEADPRTAAWLVTALRSDSNV